MQPLQTAGVAIVTGAASGMGEAAARLMSAAGWQLLLTDVNADRLEETAKRLGDVSTLAGDISDPGFIAELVSRVGNGPVGALIHCAGLSPTMAEPARILEVNLAATMRLVDAVRPRMAAGGAAVLFSSSSAYMIGGSLDAPIMRAATPEAVSSLMSLSPDSGMAYAVSKRAVQLLVRREAHAFGEYGARVASISPGIIDTPMGRSEMKSHPVMQQLVDDSPLKRSAEADEVAAVAVFLCSREASFVSGVDILVDGGALALVGLPGVDQDAA